MDNIKILGAGIAGLTAAINLKKAGIDVEVHERKKACGKQTNDFQFMENWTFEEDALDIVRSMHIHTDFYIKHHYTQGAISPSGNKYIGTSSRPVCYLIKRGRDGDSLDRSLESQCRQSNIRLVYESTLKRSEADIIATGIKRPAYICTGILFPCELHDHSYLLFDNDLSHRFYSYFVANDLVGEIVSINPVGYKDHLNRLDKTVARFEEILSIKIEEITEKFSAALSFEALDPAFVNNQYYVGEAAGFQDALMGFGMLYAFKSGYLAAKSIIEDVDYQQLLNKEIMKPINVSAANRVLFEKFTNPGYERLINVLNSENPIIRKFKGGSTLRQFLKKLYNHSMSYFLRPLLFR
ncbi:MAG: NAD(P)/FAD-dependent oxidoreductase [Deltaproteobacteria bacterium]|jgi:flavin-dependent dehydrogenase|nr:NAD(P)/FAD-dependent oxidoreductase [Deltaproteobacteria bacterium]